MQPAVSAVLSILALCVACGQPGDASSDSARAAADSRRATLSTPVAGTTDTATITTPRGPALVRGDSSPGARAVLAQPLQWTSDDVLARLTEAGLAPVPGGAAEQAGFGVPGLRISVANGAAEVRAFLYGDAGAVGVATRGFDPASVSSGSRTATLRTDNNLAAIILTGDEAVRRRIEFALTARRGEGR